MRKSILLMISCSIVVLAGCVKEKVCDRAIASGEVVIALQTDSGHGVSTKTAGSLPDVNDFKVEIYDAGGLRRYRDTYGNASGKKISLNAGMHRFLAQYGDSTGVGFNSFYYVADEKFEVLGLQVTSVSAIAKMTKVKVAVVFDESFGVKYRDWYAKVKTEDGRFIQFSKDETRAGYAPAGNLYLEVYVMDSGKWKYYAAEGLACGQNESVTFNVGFPKVTGQLGVNVTIDNTVQVVEKHWDIDASHAAKEAPAITVKNTFGNTLIAMCEQEPVQDSELRADIVAMGGIRNCFLEVSSPYLPELDGKVDLAALDSATEQLYRKAGISFLRDMKDKRLSYIDFSGLLGTLAGKIVYNPLSVSAGEVKFAVVDNDGKETASEVYRFEVRPAVSEFVISEGDVWATRLSPVSLDITCGNPARFALQYKKKDGGEFVDLQGGKIVGNSLVFSDINSLEPDTDYVVRSIYNGNPENVSEEQSFRTEAVLQVGNADFEEWTDKEFVFSVIWASSSKQVWFVPYLNESDSWWAVNSKKTMSGKPSKWNFTYKIFPTVSYTSARAHSGRSAQLASIGVDAWAIPGTGGYTTVPGEIWIGKADDSGNHVTDGHAFTSRPASVSFWRFNSPVNGESSRFYIEIRDASGAAIGSAESLCSDADTEGKMVSLDINYTDVSRKAAYIFISVKASTAPKPGYSNTEIEMAGVNYYAHVGSKINIDKITLHY